LDKKSGWELKAYTKSAETKKIAHPPSTAHYKRPLYS